MKAAPWSIHRLLPFIGYVFLVGASATPARAAEPALPTLDSYLSADTDFAKICRVAAPDVPDRDWERWNGERVDLDDETLLEVAKRQAGGSAVVKRNRVIARRLLEHLVQRNGPQLHAGKHELGQLLLDPAAGRVDTRRGLSLIREAAAAFHAPALVTLGELHQRGEAVAPDLAEATRLFKQAAALGNVDGAMHLLELSRNGVLGAADSRGIEELTRITIGLLHAQLGRGDCTAVRKIGRVLLDHAKKPDDTAVARRWFEAAIKVRDVDAALVLAENYRTGLGASFNIRRSIELLTFAADEGSARGMRMLGEMYLYGDVITADAGKALFWLSRAAEARDAKAVGLLARIHRGDFGTEPDSTAYVATLTQASILPDAQPELLTELGRAYLGGLGVEGNVELGLAALESAAAKGDPQALVELANSAMQRGEFSSYVSRIRSQLRAAANEGSGQAMRLISELYACGLGTAPNRALARRWLERAAAAGDVRSMKMLARQAAHENGSSAADRFIHLRRAALAGDRQSMVELAAAYHKGLGTGINLAEVDFWRGRALAPGKGRSGALLALARANLVGGPDQTAHSTHALLEGAIYEGDGEIVTEVGKLYLRGAPGVARNRDKGVQLLNRAARTGNVEAMLELANLRDVELKQSGRTSIEWLTFAAMSGSARAVTALAVNAPNEGDASTWLRRVEAMPICEGEIMVRLAMAYARVPGNATHAERARYWIERARQMEDLDGNALYLLSRALSAGINGEEGKTAARAYLTSAAHLGHVDAMRDIGAAELDKATTFDEVAQGLAWFERAFDAGDSKAPIEAARVLELRLPIGSELSSRTLTLLQRAADNGSARAMRELGVILQRGHGVRANAEQGARWLLLAAQNGDSIAMREIAMAYASGFGVPLSPPDSTRWMTRAADAGDPKAMRELSSAFKVGFGVAVDVAQAERWAKAANEAAQNSVE
jgi:TPR repeat protein